MFIYNGLNSFNASMFLYKCSMLFPLNGGKTSKEKIKMVKDEILRQLTLLLMESDTNGN